LCFTAAVCRFIVRDVAGHIGRARELLFEW
jgi:hypothetical protein